MAKLQIVGLTAEQINELRSHLPRRYLSKKTSDGKESEGERVLKAVALAFDLYDMWQPRTLAFAPVVSDIEAIAGAARNLLNQIRKADKTARFELDIGAENLILSLSETAGRCIDAGDVLWNAKCPPTQYIPTRPPRNEYSLISSLWDLASDLEAVAEAVIPSLPIDKNVRPERVNSERLAGVLIRCIEAGLNRDAPRTPWFCDLIAHAATFRGLKIGKATTLKQIAICASRSPYELRRTDYIPLP